MFDQTQQWQPLWWEETAQNPRIHLLDQTLLPQETVYLTLDTVDAVAEAIRALRVRGAPAIAAAAAFGVVLGLRKQIQAHGANLTLAEARACVESVGKTLAGTRPTAVNLAWAVRRLLRKADEHLAELDNAEALASLLLEEASEIVREDREACQRMGELGASLIAEGDTLLTHCNTGSLATMGIGTALAPFYVAHRAGKHIHVLVDETRPVLQGARLTAWELQRAGVPLTLITDNMAGSFMRLGRVQAVFVGADRIVANGDVANKIGTYSVAVLARAHQIPFYVVAPTSTFDFSLASGDEIPVEQRKAEEVTSIRGTVIAPAGVQVANPAFDVTPHQYVSALITEKGIFRPPYDVSLRHAW
jgi:methylthioribose-1-phosphate isomerase